MPWWCNDDWCWSFLYSTNERLHCGLHPSPRNQALSNHSRAWSLVPGQEVCGGKLESWKGGMQGMEWGNGGREEEQRGEGTSSAWPLPFSSTAGGICCCRSGRPLKSHIIHWSLESVTVSMWIKYGFLSYIHWKKVKTQEQLHTSHHLRCHHTQALLRHKLRPIYHPFLYVYPRIQLLPLRLPQLGWLQLLLQLPHVLSNKNQGFDSFCKCCRDALYFQPTFFCLACRLPSSEVAKLLLYASVISTSVSDNFLINFYCYFWFWSWLLSCDLLKMFCSTQGLCWFWSAGNQLDITCTL